MAEELFSTGEAVTEICDICGGRGYIWLPKRPRSAPSAQNPVFSQEQFGCPQCSPTVHNEPVKILFCVNAFDAVKVEAAREQCVEVLKSQAARVMAEKLLAEGLFVITEEKDWDGSVLLKAELGVVPASAVKKMKAWGKR